jgi:iron complex transport system substrate-binding protein
MSYVALRTLGLALAAVCVALTTCLVFAGCTPKEAAQPNGTAKAERIITLAPNVTEAVFALGGGSRVVGVSDFCDFPPEAANRVRVGGHLDPDFEKITMLAPDLLILQGKHQEVADFARMSGIPAVHVNMDSLESIYAGVRTIGAALGLEKQAEALCTDIQEQIEAVKQAVAALPRSKVLVITARVDHNLDNLYTVGGGSFVSELVEIAGGDNIYNEASQPYIEASKETIVVEAPDVIIEFHCGEELAPEDRAAYISDWDALRSVPAVRDGRIYLVTDIKALRPGPRIGETAKMLANLLHPDANVVNLPD